MTTNHASDHHSGTARDLSETIGEVRAAITRVAPDVDAEEIPADADFADYADLDSMDFLAVLTAVEERTGIGVPELDYPSVTTIADFAAYLARREEEG